MHKVTYANKLIGWFLLYFLITILVGIACFTAAYFLFFSHATTADFIDGLITMSPLATVFFLLNLYVPTLFYHYFRKLSTAIARVTNGDYSVRLDVEKAGPLKHVYRDFNIMVEELSHTQMLRDDFINQFSHEFKTPITAINGFAKLLQNDRLSSEEQQSYLNVIEKETHRLSNLTTNVMTLTSLEHQDIVSNQTVFDLEEQLRQSIISFYPLAEQKDISFEIALSPMTYYTNPELLQQIWTNLLANAIKFTQKKGHVTVKSWKEENVINVAFINDGPLISQDKLALLFEKFYQDETAEKAQGLGLGLTIVKRILTLIDGRITVISNEKDLTQFIVSLTVTPNIPYRH